MRAAPAFEVSLHRFGVWRAAVFGLALLGLASLGGWLLTHEEPLAPRVAWLAAFAAVLSLGCAARLGRTPPIRLRWDGLQWHLGTGASEPEPGDLSVAIDLGAWMLLRFTTALPPRRMRWLPVQRRGLAAPQWHALRCAVYSPRRAVGDKAEAGF